MKEKVALLSCDSYQLDKLERKIREGFELLGGESFIRKLVPYNSKVLLKPNLLTVEPEGSPVVTNNILFEAVIRILRDYTTNISFGDSPGFGSSLKAAQKAGLIAVAQKYDVQFDDFSHYVNVEYEKAILCKLWEIANAPYECDVLISLPKLKTHGMMYYTGAVKNQFGCVPGTRKAVWHARMQNIENFAKMLLDLNKVVDTKFAILDGIIAMEGNGPRNGSPKKLNALIMGESLTAIDSTAVRLIGYDNPLDIPQLKVAHEYHWSSVLPEDIEVLGESIENVKVEDFRLVVKNNKFFGSIQSQNILRRLLAPYPKLLEEKCISCNRCYEVCPEKPKVITMVSKEGRKFPRFDKSKCIRCFCCQELCPEGAIEVAKPILSKIIK